MLSMTLRIDLHRAARALSEMRNGARVARVRAPCPSRPPQNRTDRALENEVRSDSGYRHWPGRALRLRAARARSASICAVERRFDAPGERGLLPTKGLARARAGPHRRRR